MASITALRQIEHEQQSQVILTNLRLLHHLCQFLVLLFILVLSLIQRTCLIKFSTLCHPTQCHILIKHPQHPTSFPTPRAC